MVLMMEAGRLIRLHLIQVRTVNYVWIYTYQHQDIFKLLVSAVFAWRLSRALRGLNGP